MGLELIPGVHAGLEEAIRPGYGDVYKRQIVNFGPVDFALSKNKVFCGMDMPEIVDALTTIIEKCRAKNISVMVPGIPPTYESVKSIIDMGANMLAVGTDIMHFNNGLRTVKENVVSKFQS